MITARRLRVALLALSLALVACGPQAQLSPTVAPAVAEPLPTSTATPAATQPAPSLSPPTPSMPPTAAPIATPTAPPWTGRLAAGTVALYTAGLPESPQLYALAANGSSTDLGRAVTASSAASPSGRWIVRLDRADSPGAAIIDNLEDGRAYEIPFGLERTDIVGQWAFDRGETRLALLEVAPAAGGWRWAIAVVDLRDGSSARFEASRTLPGSPLGWSASGDELLVATFQPYTESGWWGVCALALPPGTAATPLEKLGRRQLLPDGACRSLPRLSPDGARLLYLARDPSYTPADYRVWYIDAAVNQLWSLDLRSGERTLLVEAKDGSALAADAAWSPDGQEILFAQGRYDGDNSFASATLKVRGASGAVRDIATLPSPGHIGRLAWCAHDVALATAAGGLLLYSVDLAGGRATLVASAPYVSVAGCVR